MQGKKMVTERPAKTRITAQKDVNNSENLGQIFLFEFLLLLSLGFWSSLKTYFLLSILSKVKVIVMQIK